MNTKFTRRRFLKTGVITAAVTGIALCGGTTLAVTYEPKIDMPSKNYGDKTMNHRILIAYASKAGSTAEIAVRMGETLSKANYAVDVLPVNKVTDLAPYQAVILGSAIRMGKVLPEATSFLEKNLAAVKQKAFSAFVVCLTLKDDSAENRKTVSAYLDPLRALAKPASEGLFAGVMNPAKVGLIERLMMAAMKSPTGDFRNWDQIDAYAASLPAIL